MTLYETISTEFDALGLVRVPQALERFSASLGCHLFNISNLVNKRFYFGGGLENFRTSIVFMAPSGYSKSQHFNFFLNPKTGILAKTGVISAVRGTFSSESWMGTISNGQESKGLLSTYKQGIIGADEFMRLGSMMCGSGVNHDEVYLMKALDCDTVTKDLAYGTIEENDIGITLWSGMRIANLNLTSGLARRFSFQIFFPTMTDSINFRKAARSGKMSMRIKPETHIKMKDEVQSTFDYINTINTVDYSNVEKWIDDSQIAIPHFEEVLYKRLALGWAVVNKSLPVIEIDPLLDSLLKDELRVRDIIRTNPHHELVRHVIEAEGEVPAIKLMKFLEKNYQLHKVEVQALINELKRNEIIQAQGDNYTLPGTLETGGNNVQEEKT